jgi:hypothetical protein
MGASIYLWRVFPRGVLYPFPPQVHKCEALPWITAEYSLLVRAVMGGPESLIVNPTLLSVLRRRQVG